MCPVTVVNTPNKTIMEINNTIQNFIWQSSTSKIAQETLIQQIEKDGLKLCHFETKAKALKLSWVKALQYSCTLAPPCVVPYYPPGLNMVLVCNCTAKP